MSDKPTAGKAIRAYRTGKKHSLDWLADRVRDLTGERPSVAKLSRIENGQPCPVDLVPTLEKITGVPAKEIRPDLAKVFDRESAQ